MIALGEVKNLSEAAEKIVRWDKRFEPNAEVHAIYNDKYHQWRSVYDEMLPMAEKRIVSPLFWAPGA